MKNDVGVFQLDNGYWAFRIVTEVNGKQINIKRRRGIDGSRFKTKKQAIKARQEELFRIKSPYQPLKTERKTYSEVFAEYCEKGRLDKAFSTIRKQDSLWNNHLKKTFGNRYVDEVSVAEINDYLSRLYYTDGRAYSYVESFLKMFYLILGQAYSRNYLSADAYAKLCLNKGTRIKMPKRRLVEEDDVITFSKDIMALLDNYFKNTNAETAYMLGKYCGLRISECYGIMWRDLNFETRSISIARQMQYVDGVVKLVPPKTRNAFRTIYMSDPLYEYLWHLKCETEEYNESKSEVRKQKSILIPTTTDEMISSLELVNTLPNGKVQTVNSMKFHSKKIKSELDIVFKYHYLRHTYGTMLAEMNTPISLLCNQMGHASSRVTERYYIGLSKRGIDLLVSNLNKL